MGDRRLPPFLFAVLTSLAPAAARADDPPPPPPATDEERFRRLEQRILQLEEENRQARAREAAARLAAPPPPAPSAIDRPALGTTFRDGSYFQSSDGNFRFRSGGIVQADGRYFAGPQPAGVFSNFALRSARLDLEGSMWKLVDFRFMPDFAGGKLQVQDGYVELRLLRQVRIRAGKFKVPFGLERLAPEGRTAFLERGFPTGISPNRDIGVALFVDYADGALEAGAGVFNGVADNSTVDGETDDDKEVALRLFFHPFRPLGIAALHDLGAGGAFTYGKLHGNLATPSTNVVKTDGLNDFFKFDAAAIADGERIRGAAQGYWYYGRLGLLGEYVWNSQILARGATRVAVPTQAGQLYATFLLTADRAAYKGVKPRRPLDLSSREAFAIGAWEIGFRYSRLWIYDSGISSGMVDPTKSARAAASYTVGLNWYWNANAKFQLDFVRTDFTGGAPGGDRARENALMGRAQFNL